MRSSVILWIFISSTLLLAQAKNDDKDSLLKKYKGLLEKAQKALQESEEKLAAAEKQAKSPGAKKEQSKLAVRKWKVRVEVRRRLIEVHTYMVQLAEAKKLKQLERVESYAQELLGVFDVKATIKRLEKEQAASRKMEALAKEEDEPELAKEIRTVVNLRKKLLRVMSEMQIALGEVAAEDDEEEYELEELFSQSREQAKYLSLRQKIIDRTVQMLLAMERGDEERAELHEKVVRRLRQEAGLEDPEEVDETDLPKPLVLNGQQLRKYGAADFTSQVMPLLKRHCLDCHGPDTQEAELNLAAEVLVKPLVKHGEVWDKVIAHVKGRVMPPAEESEMSDAERSLLAGYFEHQTKNFDYSKVDNPGFEGSRRLTHAEYNHSIRDLLGTDYQPADKFPTELAGISGFDNSANTLFLHRQLMERYFGAAEAAVENALPARRESAAHRRSYERIFIAKPGARLSEEQAARAIMERFLMRAYRRPPTAQEVNSVLAQFNRSRKQGSSFDDAIRGVIQMTLVSPKFLLRIESWRDSKESYPISSFDLASRLSYFLWASTPDDELLKLASQDKLRDSKILRAQVERMLADARSQTLGTEFVGQWLGSQHLGVRIRPDPIDNPWCTDSLMESLKAETAFFFHSLVRDNAPVSRLVDADYTFLNEEVARHYGIRGIEGKQMRRVRLNDKSRGGIFGQGALLAITSFPGRTSPVVRGKWILSDVLGTPPPPPPPDVSEISDEIAEKRFLTPRQKLQMHRRKPNCYACHSQIDPLGFSLEGFDWFGRKKRSRRGRAVDVKGKLPNGTEFEGPSGLKRVIVEQRMEDLARQVTRKLLSYGLGRQLEYYDEPAIRKILKQAQADDYRLQTIVFGIVESYPFQFKMNPPKPESN